MPTLKEQRIPTGDSARDSESRDRLTVEKGDVLTEFARQALKQDQRRLLLRPHRSDEREERRLLPGVTR